MTQNEKESIKLNIEDIKRRAYDAMTASGRNPSELRIVLATKTQPAERINYAAECGITEIGENRVQELLEKYDSINKDKLNIHFIGTLQTNKVKYIIDKVSLIHSVNSIKLAAEIDKQAAKHGKVQDILIEINAASEQSKTGIAESELYDLINYASTLKNVKVKGLMAIPPAPQISPTNNNFDEKSLQIVNNLQINADSACYFDKIHQIFLDISAKKIDNISMEILSLGMSSDFPQAIKSGSTLIRPGRAVFGERPAKTTV